MSTLETTSTSLPVIDTESLRQKLAGLSDPMSRDVGSAEKTEIRETANRLCSILASLFGPSLERTTLWSRIGSALETSLAKVSDDDLDRFASLCLEHVCAEPASVAACDALRDLLQTCGVRPAEWRFAFLNYLRSHAYAVLVHGRARWEQVKSKEIDL